MAGGAGDPLSSGLSLDRRTLSCGVRGDLLGGTTECGPRRPLPIERELGAGGMATVYLARDLKHDRNVAIKVLKPELAAALGAERFLREIRPRPGCRTRTSCRSRLGGGGRLLYYVMPYVEGESLRERLDREKQLPLDDALQDQRAKSPTR